MSLPPLATVGDMEKRLGLAPGALTGANLARAGAALEDISSLIRQEAGVAWVAADGVTITAPEAAVTVARTAALRAYRNPDGFMGESVGSYSYQYATGSTSAYLTGEEVRVVKRAAATGGGNAGVYTIRTPSAYDDGTGWVDWPYPPGLYWETYWQDVP